VRDARLALRSGPTSDDVQFSQAGPMNEDRLRAQQKSNSVELEEQAAGKHERGLLVRLMPHRRSWEDRVRKHR
jgi:hypothetical protein